MHLARSTSALRQRQTQHTFVKPRCTLPALGLSSLQVHGRNQGSRRQDRLAAQRQGLDAYQEDADEGVPDIWMPVPPTPALGRKRKVAVLVAAAMLEITMTGVLVWSPLLCAVALAVLQPTKAEIEQQQEEAVKQAVAAAEVQAYRHLPVTPVESAAWVNRLNQEMWATFWQPFLLANNLSSWQDTVSAAAPRGWEVEIADVSIGTLAPQMSGFQAFADPDTGAVTAVDADMAFNSSSVVLVVVGRGPLGAFTAKVSAVQMEGHIRIIPLLQHRMLLVAFKQPPSVRVSLSLSAPLFKTALSPGDLGQLNFIQGLIGSAIKDQLVEPRRMAISLDSDIRVEQAVSTTLHLTVDTISGLPRSTITAGSSGGRGTAGAVGGSKVALVLIDTTTQVRRASRAVSPSPMRRSAQLQQSLSLELRRKQGLFKLEVREMAWGPGGRVSASRGQLLGSCLLWVAAARDGTTLFWSHDRSGAPLASRWSPASNKPWQVLLPLSPEVPGAQALQVSVGVAVEPWVYKAGFSPGLPGGHQRTPGPRVVILQVVEARGLQPSGGHSLQGPTTHIQVAYGQDVYKTSTQYGTSSPIFNEVFAFEESTSTITNRVRLEVWQDDLPAAATNTAVDGSTHTPTAVSSNGSTGKSQGSSSSRRALVPSSRRGLTGLKAHNKLRYSSSFKSSGGSSGGSSSSSKGSGGSSLASYQLSDVEPESESAEPDSHMLVDVELEDEDSLSGSSWGSAAGSNGSSGGGSGGSSSSGSASLGSTFIELDQLTETLVQDRWFELTGSEGGAVRVRLAVVPGSLPGLHSSRRHQALAGNDGDVLHMLSFFHKQLQRSSRDSINVEVLSARLYLPLSSMDSSDLDQPSYVLSYGGRSTVASPPHSTPTRSRTSTRRSSGSSSSWSRPSGGAARGSRSSSADSSGRALDSVTSSMFEDVGPGNVSQQILEETCLARAVFPLYPEASQASAAALSAAASGASAAGRAEAAAVAGSAGGQEPPARLKVLLFDPEDLSHASPAAAAAAIAAAAASHKSRAPSPTAGATAAADTPAPSASRAGAAAAGGPVAHPLSLSSVSSSSSNANVLSDIGGVEVDVLKLLAAARQGRTLDAAAGEGSPQRGTVLSAAALASWEGWVKLDKDGGHLLLRLTQLAAAEPADLVPPIAAASTATAAAAAGGPGSSSSSRSTGSQHPSGGGSEGAAGSTDSMSSVEEGDQGLQDRIAAVLKDSVAQAQGQVIGAVHQLTDATTAAAQWINSSSSWITSSVPAWATPWRSNSSTAQQQQQQQQPGVPAGKPQAGTADTSGREAPGSQKQASLQQVGSSMAGGATAAASSTDRAAAGVQQQQQQQGSQNRPKKQQEAGGSSLGVDLRFISRALGLGGGGGSSKQAQQQQQPQPPKGAQQQQQQQQQQQKEQQKQRQADILSHPLPYHALQDSSPASTAGLQSSIGQAMQVKPDATGHATGPEGSAAGRNSSSTSDGSSSSSSGAGGLPQQQQQQRRNATGPDAAAQSDALVQHASKPQAASLDEANSSTGTSQQRQGQGQTGAAAAVAGVAGTAAALGLRSHPVSPAADQWSYDGFGDEGQDSPGAEWEGAKEQQEF